MLRVAGYIVIFLTVGFYKFIKFCTQSFLIPTFYAYNQIIENCILFLNHKDFFFVLQANLPFLWYSELPIRLE